MKSIIVLLAIFTLNAHADIESGQVEGQITENRDKSVTITNPKMSRGRHFLGLYQEGKSMRRIQKHGICRLFGYSQGIDYNINFDEPASEIHLVDEFGKYVGRHSDKYSRPVSSVTCINPETYKLIIEVKEKFKNPDGSVTFYWPIMLLGKRTYRIYKDSAKTLCQYFGLKHVLSGELIIAHKDDPYEYYAQIYESGNYKIIYKDSTEEDEHKNPIVEVTCY